MNMKAVAAIVVAAALAGGVLVGQRFTPARRGDRAFQRLGCGGCHFSGAGPNLSHVVREHDPKLLERFIGNPPAVYRERGIKSLNDGYMLMPDMHASHDDARLIVAYLKELDKQ